MRIGEAFLIVSTLLLYANVGVAAEELDIILTRNSVIQDGDNYDDVFVYGLDTVVNITGGKIGRLWCRERSTVNISGGRVTYAQSHEQSTITITGGIVTEPSIWDAKGTVNIRGGICWNVKVGNGVLNVSGGQITGLGISVPAPGGVVNIIGYGFEYYPLPGISDGRLKGYWRDGTAFSIDFLRDAYRAVVLQEISTGSAPMADAGMDRTVLAVKETIVQVSLDGSASTDPDGDPLTYAWMWTLNGDTFVAYGPNPTIMLPVGKHTIELIVRDGTEDSKPDRVIITVQTLSQEIYTIRAEKLQLVESIDTELAREQQVADTLSGLLVSGNHGNLPRDSILAAREAIYSSIQHQERARKSLQTSIENLEEVLLLIDSPVMAEETPTSDKK